MYNLCTDAFEIRIPTGTIFSAKEQWSQLGI